MTDLKQALEVNRKIVITQNELILEKLSIIKAQEAVIWMLLKLLGN